jgi:predicted MFS family arabinose efflux permease
VKDIARLPAYWLAWFATVTFFAGFYALLVPLPRYLASVGLVDWQIGLVLGAFGIASLIGRPIAGAATDRFGSRPILLCGAASLAVGALAVAYTADLGLLTGLRLLQAIGYVAFTTAGTALIVSLVSPETRARRLAVFGVAANLAIALTPVGISTLLDFAPVEAGLLAAAGLAALAGALALGLPGLSALADQCAPQSSPTKLRLPSRVEPSGGRSPLQKSATRRRIIQWSIPRCVWLPMLAAGLLGAGFAAFFQFAPILGERRGVSSGLLYTIYGASIIATRVFAGRLLDRFSVAGIVALAAVLMALGHALVAATDSAAPLLIAPVLIAVSGGLFHPTLIAHHAALLPETPGRASAAFYVAFDLGIGLGSWLFGLMLQLAGLAGLYWCAAALAVCVLPLAGALSRSARQPASSAREHREAKANHVAFG